MFGSPALLERRQPAHAHGATVGQPALSEELVALSRMPAQAACTECASCVEGLDQAEAERRLAYFGPNLITRDKKPTILRELLGRVKNPLNALLLTLAIVSYFLGDIRAAAVIAIMILLAVTTAFIQEHRSNEAAAKLRALVKTTASVNLRWATLKKCVRDPMQKVVLDKLDRDPIILDPDADNQQTITPK